MSEVVDVKGLLNNCTDEKVLFILNSKKVLQDDREVLDEKYFLCRTQKKYSKMTAKYLMRSTFYVEVKKSTPILGVFCVFEYRIYEHV